MRFASLGSGSKGNGTLVATENTCVLVDCGFTIKKTEQRLARLGKTAEDITAIVVTHEHGDHISGVGPFARKYDKPVYITAGTHRTGKLGEVSKLELISSHHVFQIGDLTINPVPVPHDAKEPVQFVFSFGKKKLGVLTDLGSTTQHITKQYEDCDALILESNHCPEMLLSSSYPYSVQQRVGGDWGHLSNQQAASFLKATFFKERSALQYLVLAHLSEENNSQHLVEGEVVADIVDRVENVLFASQDNGFDWLQIY